MGRSRQSVESAANGLVTVPDVALNVVGKLSLNVVDFTEAGHLSLTRPWQSRLRESPYHTCGNPMSAVHRIPTPRPSEGEEMSNEPIDPMNEAAKQYYRDNPHMAARDHALAGKIFFAILIFSVIVGLIMKALS